MSWWYTPGHESKPASPGRFHRHTGRVVRRRLLLIAGPCSVAVAMSAAALAVSGCGESTDTGASASQAPPAYEALPTRKTRPKAVEPVAGETAATAALPTEKASDRPPLAGASAPLSRSQRSPARSTSPTGDAAISA